MEIRYYMVEKRLLERKETEKNIRKLKRLGMSVIDISSELGISEATVRNILK